MNIKNQIHNTYIVMISITNKKKLCTMVGFFCDKIFWIESFLNWKNELVI